MTDTLRLENVRRAGDGGADFDVGWYASADGTATMPEAPHAVSWTVAVEGARGRVRIALGAGFDEHCALELPPHAASTLAETLLEKAGRPARDDAEDRGPAGSAGHGGIRFEVGGPLGRATARRGSRCGPDAADGAWMILSPAEARSLGATVADAAERVRSMAAGTPCRDGNRFERVERTFAAMPLTAAVRDAATGLPAPGTLSAGHAVPGASGYVVLSDRGAFGLGRRTRHGMLEVYGSLDGDVGMLYDATLDRGVRPSVGRGRWAALAWAAVERDARRRDDLLRANPTPLTLALTTRDVAAAREALRRLPAADGWRDAATPMATLLATGAAGLSLPEYRRTVLGNRPTGRVFEGVDALDRMDRTFGRGRHRTMTFDVAKGLGAADGRLLERFAALVGLAVETSASRGAGSVRERLWPARANAGRIDGVGR